MKKPYVSICIPTFNRASQLECTLRSLVSQAAFMDGRVEIVISDNASSDNTETLARNYTAQYENVLYFRNVNNVMDANFPLALSRANGVLRKLHNDTLLMKTGVLEQLCKIVENYQKDRPCVFLTNGHRKHGSIEMVNFREFVVSEGYRVTWLGSFAIWDNECNGIADDQDGCELKLWQVRKFYENAYKKDSVLIFDGVFGEGQTLPKKDISYGLYTVFYQNYMQLLLPYVANGAIEISDIELIEKDMLYRFFTPWIIEWELHNEAYYYSEKENLRECVFRQYQNKPYWRDYVKYYKMKLIFKKISVYLKL